MIQKITVFTFSLFLLLSCSTMSIKTNNVGNIYFSGQPTKEDLKKLKEQGFTTVINMRSPKEHDEAGERSILQKDGINYYNMPFPKNLKINDDYTDKIYSTIKKNRKSGKTLIHCSSGNRVAIWIGAHFHRHHDTNKEDSISKAKELGLTKSKAEKALKKYLESK